MDSGGFWFQKKDIMNIHHSEISNLYKKSNKSFSMQDISNQASKINLKENIERVIQILKEEKLDILIVNLTKHDIPFRVVRVIIPQLQPLDHEEYFRFSKRLFEVPKKLGYHREVVTPDNLMLGPPCGMSKGQK